jgi:stage V sporulation protein SpoVS
VVKVGESFLIQKLIQSGGSVDYVNYVAQDENGAKYEAFNGYDFLTNPTPATNYSFNQWILNNSATGDVILNNTIMTSSTFNGPDSVLNQSNLAFLDVAFPYGQTTNSIVTNNGFIYVTGNFFGTSSNSIRKYNETTLEFVGNTVNLSGYGRTLAINDGFIYVSGSVGGVRKFNELTLDYIGNTVPYGGGVESIAINDGFIYVGGLTADVVSKYDESTLAFIGNTATYGNDIRSIAINNGFIYAGGGFLAGTNRGVAKYNETTLALIGNTVNFSTNDGVILSIAINDGFIYAGGINGANVVTRINSSIKKYAESSLVFAGNTPVLGTNVFAVTTNNGFIYAATGTVNKFNESTLSFVSNTVSYGATILALAINNGFIYAGGGTNLSLKKFQEVAAEGDNQTYYTITNVKEE